MGAVRLEYMLVRVQFAENGGAANNRGAYFGISTRLRKLLPLAHLRFLTT